MESIGFTRFALDPRRGLQTAPENLQQHTCLGRRLCWHAYSVCYVARARPGLYKAWGGRQKQEYMGVPAMLSLDYFNLKLG